MVRSDADWREVRREYENTDKSLRAIARGRRVSESALAARALKEGWRRADADEGRLSGLKRAADMAVDAILDAMADENQFCRHAYADKGSGEIMETTLKLRNVKQLREAIGAIRELADAMRGLYGILSPQERLSAEAQIKKLELEEKKLAPMDAGDAETGVVLLPADGAPV